MDETMTTTEPQGGGGHTTHTAAGGVSCIAEQSTRWTARVATYDTAGESVRLSAAGACYS